MEAEAGILHELQCGVGVFVSNESFQLLLGSVSLLRGVCIVAKGIRKGTYRRAGDLLGGEQTLFTCNVIWLALQLRKVKLSRDNAEIRGVVCG